jgi:heme exporter protein C
MDKKPKLLFWLDVTTAFMVSAALGMVFLYAPIEAVMGPVQKIFYFHVAVSWVGMLSFIVAAVSGVVYLRKQTRFWDIVGTSTVEIGLVFILMTIVSGSIWARPIWNTWWTWDPRLTTVTIMELIYLAYIMLRQGIDDPERRARFGAVYAIIGTISVPLTFISIRIFRTIHPVLIFSGDPTSTGAFDMSPRMLQTFIVSLIAFTIFFIDLLWHRIRLGQLNERVERLKLEKMS